MNRVLGKLSSKLKSRADSEMSFALIPDTVDANQLNQLPEFSKEKKATEADSPKSNSMRQLAGALLKEFDAG